MLWAYRWRAYWFDRSWRRQEILHPPRSFEGEGGRNLVFVLGFWRSGTTFLHELLASGPKMAAPLTWQCLNPSGFRIVGPPRATARLPRPMDSVTVSAQSPQEDEFALLARGAPSAYRAWIDPRRWDDAVPALRQETWLSLPERDWFVDWRNFLDWCFPEGAAALAVKSPNHAFRLKAIQRAWPLARHAWVVRDAADTWRSNRKMWGAMTALYGLWPCDPDATDRFIFLALAEYAKALRWAAEAMPPEQLAFVPYDRLTDAPSRTLQTLISRMGLGAWEAWQPSIGQYLAHSSGHKADSYAGARALPEYGSALIGEIDGLHARVLRSRHAIA